MYEAVAKDNAGIKRVWGSGATQDEAWNNCYREAWQYISSRPDIKQLHIWIDGKCRESISRTDY